MNGDETPILAQLVERAPPPKPFPGIGGAILLVLLLTGLQLGGGICLGILSIIVQQFKLPVDEASVMAAGMVAIQLLSFLPVIIFGLQVARRPWQEAMPLARFRPAVLLPLVPGVAGMIILLSEADNLVRFLLPMPDFLAQLFQQLAGGGPWAILALVIVAPVTEELLFRGLILTGFLPRYGPARAIAYTAILFAICHWNPYQLAVGLMMGAFLGWLLVRTRSLWPCMLMHALFNSNFFLTALLRDAWGIHIPGFTGPPAQGIVEFQPLWFDGLGVLLACVSVWGVMALTRGADPAATTSTLPDTPGAAAR